MVFARAPEPFRIHRMANKIKFCKTCNSTSADDFVFCPVCGNSLEEFFQSNDPEPLDEGSSDGLGALIETAAWDLVDPDTIATSQLSLGDANESETQADSVPVYDDANDETADDAVEGDGILNLFEERTSGTGSWKPSAGGELSLTIVDENTSDTKKRLMLLAALLILSLAGGSWLASLFGIANEVNFLDGDLVVAARILEDDILAKIEEEEKRPKRNKGEKEGGGGGGREESTPPSKGRLVTQSEKPLFPPSPNFEQAKTSLPIIQSTEGNTERPITDQRAGIPTSLSEDPSSGPGRGGGIGTGVGPSQGGGVGTSLGNRRGIGGCPEPPCGGDDDAPAIRRGETVGVKILAQPRASYTDAARQAGIQGKVVLRVTLQADGSVGSISAVSGLPNGLTERAIAAARSIRFEPAKRNGVPYSVTRTIEYSFTIY